MIENDAVVFIQTDLEGDLVGQIDQVATRQKKRTSSIINLYRWSCICCTHITNGWKHAKGATNCVDSLQKLFFENLKNHYGNTIYQNIYLIFEISFYTFKVATTKFSWNSSCFKSLFICLKHFKKNVDKWFFCFKSHFSLIRCSPNHFNFLGNCNTFHKKGSMCSKHSKK